MRNGRAGGITVGDVKTETQTQCADSGSPVTQTRRLGDNQGNFFMDLVLDDINELLILVSMTMTYHGFLKILVT